MGPPRANWIEQFGEARADWMLNYSRNLCLYPNVYIMDQFGSQIRHFRPIAVDQTEVTIYCIAPKGESAETRAARIRQYEDFFNASGMATPDDLEEFRSCQKTYLATRRPVERHEPRRHPLDRRAGDDEAKELGLDPISTGVKTEDEGLYITQHSYWQKHAKAAPRKQQPNPHAEPPARCQSNGPASRTPDELTRPGAAP